MDSTLGCIGVVEKKNTSSICSKDSMTDCLFLLQLPQNPALVLLPLCSCFVISSCKKGTGRRRRNCDVSSRTNIAK